MITTLIVDDEELSRRLLKVLINRNNIPLDVVGEASNGKEAIELIFKLKPSLVLLDIEMPNGNGMDVMNHINKHYIGAITFIIITAFSYFEYAQTSLRLGAKDILLKPVELSALEKSISRVVGYELTNNPLLNDILQHLSINYNDNITLKGYAKEFHISENQINKLFKEYLSMTFIRYINKYRIQKSIKMLQQKDLTIQQIAFEVGFNNINYFYKTFKIVTGNTPGFYRKYK